MQSACFSEPLYGPWPQPPREPVTLSRGAPHVDDSCPVCGSVSQIEIGMDGDWDELPCPHLSKYVCSNCGFALDDADDIEVLLGNEAVMEILYGSHSDPF